MSLPSGTNLSGALFAVYLLHINTSRRQNSHHDDGKDTAPHKQVKYVIEKRVHCYDNTFRTNYLV